MGGALKKTKKSKITSAFSIFLMLVFLVYSNIGFFVSKNNSNSLKFKFEKTSETKKSVIELLGDSELNEDDNTDDDDISSELFSYINNEFYTYIKLLSSDFGCHFSQLPHKAQSCQHLFVLISVFRI